VAAKNADHISLQVKVSDGSCSELRPVAVVKQGDRLQFAEPQSYVPLDTTWFDWACSIALRIDWPLWGYRCVTDTHPPGHSPILNHRSATPASGFNSTPASAATRR
jgi:hypothetical protein